jgi:peptidoglycan/LPS O-acetylase OafA/YrhL
VAATPLHPLTKRNPVLDGVRALAIGMVIAHHAGLAVGGGIGVTVFFVLSGFLITGLLTKPGALSRPGLKAFYMRRFLRLFPALAAVAGFCLVWAFSVLEGDDRRFLLTQILTSVTYTQDFYMGRGASTEDYGYLGHTWSLAIEEQFYLLWPPLLMAILAVAKRTRTRIACIAAVAVAVALRRAYLAHKGLDAHVGLNIDAQADSLLVGCSLALALPWLRPRLPRCQRALDIAAVVALVLLASFAVARINIHSPGRIGYVLISISTAVLLLRLLTPPERRTGRLLAQAFAWRPVVFIGLISYSLYLVHVVLFTIAKRDLGLDSGVEQATWAPLLLSCTLAVAYALYRGVETPFQLWKGRWFPEPAVAIREPQPSDSTSPRAPITV